MKLTFAENCVQSVIFEVSCVFITKQVNVTCTGVHW